MLETKDIEVAAEQIRQGEVIAYPTESVFGLGCDIYNATAVEKLLAAKQRPTNKGFIIIASDFSQVEELLESLEPRALARITASWPGAITWVFPCKADVPYHLRGEHNSIAIRITAHPVARALCQTLGQAIISTSANLSGQLPATDAKTIRLQFAGRIACLLDGALGGLAKPTPIFNMLVIAGSY